MSLKPKQHFATVSLGLWRLKDFVNVFFARLGGTHYIQGLK